jgi:3D (Asp-Asp-Asp) domain-containing protein
VEHVSRRILAGTVALVVLAHGSIQPATAQVPHITNADVVSLARAGISDAVIVATIRGTAAPAFDLLPDRLLELKAAGVSDAVIAAMIAAVSPEVERTATSPQQKTDVLGITTVPDGTDLRLRLLMPLSSASARRGDPVRFEVSSDVTVRGVVVIAKGAEATGRVGEVAKSKSFGRPGKLEIDLTSVDAVDGSRIPIRSERELKGDGRLGATVVAVALVGVFGGFVKGKNIDVAAGSEFDAFTSGERDIHQARR